MITIVAKNTIKPGFAEAFKRAARPLAEASQCELGCISYDLYEDMADPNTLTFIEQWADEAAIERHNQSEHFRTILPLFASFVAKEGEVRRYSKVAIQDKEDK